MAVKAHVSFAERATMPKETDVEATLENCRALINQIIAGLSAEEPLVSVSSAKELLLYLECAASASQRDVMKLIVRGLSNKEIASILNLAEGLTAKECLQSAEVCLALAHKTKELDTRAALLEFAYEFRTVAKRLERDERKLMMRAASDGTQQHGV
jgi:ATP/maltotriose-dependent transcriptional regulator MalT